MRLEAVSEQSAHAGRTSICNLSSGSVMLACSTRPINACFIEKETRVGTKCGRIEASTASLLTKQAPAGMKTGEGPARNRACPAVPIALVNLQNVFILRFLPALCFSAAVAYSDVL